MTEQYYWRTEDPMVFIIEGRELNLETRGVDYAKQFADLTGWLGTHGLGGLISAYQSGVLDESESDYEMMSGLIGYLLQYGVSPEALIELGAIVLNTDKEFAEENFDPGWFVDGLLTIVDNRPGIKDAFVRIWQRFFLAAQPDTGDQESQAQD